MQNSLTVLKPFSTVREFYTPVREFQNMEAQTPEVLKPFSTVREFYTPVREFQNMEAQTLEAQTKLG